MYLPIILTIKIFKRHTTYLRRFIEERMTKVTDSDLVSLLFNTKEDGE
jgi:hypothetical protein